METVYHTPIEIKPIAKNGSERFGAKAECKMWYKGSSFKMDVSQHGATKKEAEQKLRAFMSANGINKTVGLSAAEALWLDRTKQYIKQNEDKLDYVCSWWLRLEYATEKVTTAKIYELSKLVAKGILKKETNKSHTKFSFA